MNQMIFMDGLLVRELPRGCSFSVFERGGYGDKELHGDLYIRDTSIDPANLAARLEIVVYSRDGLFRGMFVYDDSHPIEKSEFLGNCAVVRFRKND